MFLKIICIIESKCLHFDFTILKSVMEVLQTEFYPQNLNITILTFRDGSFLRAQSV